MEIQADFNVNSTKKTIKFNDFLQLIEDESKNMDKIRSPKFRLAGDDFSIDVYPDNSANDWSGSIGVYLHNYGNEDQTISISVKESTGEKESLEMEEVEAGDRLEVPLILSHSDYREWAEDHGDVFKLEVMVTVHSKAEGDGWTR